MKPMFGVGVLATSLLWAGSVMAAAQGVPIQDPLRVDFPADTRLTEAVIGERIKYLTTARSWRVESEQPGRLMVATSFNNKHMVRVQIDYAADGYTLRYLDSFNLRYRADSRTIHPNYNLWMQDLCKAINGALGITAVASVPLTIPIAAAVPSAAVQAASGAPEAGAEGLPAKGAKWRYGYRDRQFLRGERFFTVEMSGLEQGRVRERMVVDGGSPSESVIYADRFAFATRALGGGTNVVELTPYLRDMQNRPSQPPSGYPAADGTQWKISAPEYVEEEVQVPAGTFKALRIEVRGTSQAFGGALTGTSRFVYVAWYSRELGRYVKTQHQTWNRQNARTSDEHMQLVSFQLK